MILSKSLPLPEAVFSSWKGDSCVTDLWHMIYILSGSFTSFFSAVGYKHFQFLLNSISLFIENKFKREKAARSPEQRLRKHEYIWSHQLTLSPSLKQIGCYCFPYKEFIGGQPLTAKMEPELSLFILLHNMSVSLSLPLPEFIFLHSIFKQLYKGLLVYLPQLNCKFLESKGFILFTATLPSA